jgi:hypothetical protein
MEGGKIAVSLEMHNENDWARLHEIPMALQIPHPAFAVQSSSFL